MGILDSTRNRIIKLLDTEKNQEQKPVQLDRLVFTGKDNFTLDTTETIQRFDASKPISIKTTPTIPRVSKADLEQDYFTEPTVFNSINKTTQLISSAGYYLRGKEKSISFFEEFFDRIGQEGGETEWKEILSLVFKHQFLYGSAWDELIPAKRNRDKIVDVDILDPKKMDYAKDNDNRIVLTDVMEPVGYTETLPPDYSIDRESNKYEAPEKVHLEPNQIFFPPERVVHYKLYTVGDGFYPIGLIEPSHKAIVRKIKMEEALANAVNRTGFPIRKVKVGDLNHEPTEDTIQKSVESIRNMNYMGTIGFPYYVDVSLDEPRNAERLQEHLRYYTEQIVTGTGLPSSLVTGIGADVNRATLSDQKEVAEQALRDIVNRTVKQIEKRIIVPVAKANGIEPVKIIWGKIAIKDLDTKAKRLTEYAKVGLLTPDENIENIIRKMEELPERIKDERTKN